MKKILALALALVLVLANTIPAVACSDGDNGGVNIGNGHDNNNIVININIYPPSANPTPNPTSRPTSRPKPSTSPAPTQTPDYTGEKAETELYGSAFVRTTVARLENDDWTVVWAVLAKGANTYVASISACKGRVTLTGNIVYTRPSKWDAYAVAFANAYHPGVLLKNYPSEELMVGILDPQDAVNVIASWFSLQYIEAEANATVTVVAAFAATNCGCCKNCSCAGNCHPGCGCECAADPGITEPATEAAPTQAVGDATK